MSSNNFIISGIQQVGVGVKDADLAFEWYRKNLGLDIPVFKDAAIANLMLPYTGGKPHERYAILAINIQGGGGFEIWQYKSRTPVAANFEILTGDLGINYPIIKAIDVNKAYQHLKQNGVELLSEPSNDPIGNPTFFMKDLYGNIFQIKKGLGWFKNNGDLFGGVGGAIMGVSNMDISLPFYQNILGYDQIVYDHSSDSFSDLNNLPGYKQSFRRVLLRHSQARKGAFSPLLGPTEIELIQVLDRIPNKIFTNRFWGDLGYIHLCFDVRNMAALKDFCQKAGHPFTVDSNNSFDMGEAAGHFAYIEDPDGAWIEFVEAHRIPIMKKWGWFLNIKNRNPEKALPRWMLSAMGLNRVKK